MNATLLGIIQKDISTFKEKEEIQIVCKVKGNYFQSGTGYIIVSPLPPFNPICIDSSYIQTGESTNNLMELSEYPYPIYKGLYKGELKDEDGFLLKLNTEVYVLSTIESFVFKKEKGFVVALRSEINPYPYDETSIMYAPFVVDSEDLLFEFESFIPVIKEELNTF